MAEIVELNQEQKPLEGEMAVVKPKSNRSYNADEHRSLESAKGAATSKAAKAKPKAKDEAPKPVA